MPRLQVTVVYARPDHQWVIAVELEERATLKDAFEASGLRNACAELAIGEPDLGLFHRRRDGGTPLRQGDRIEVYRPLHLDPMEARRLRAQRYAAKTGAKNRTQTGGAG